MIIPDQIYLHQPLYQDYRLDGVDFSKPSERAVVVGIDKTKLSPLEYAKAHFTKWPAAVYLAENIRVMEESTA